MKYSTPVDRNWMQILTIVSVLAGLGFTAWASIFNAVSFDLAHLILAFVQAGAIVIGLFVLVKVQQEGRLTDGVRVETAGELLCRDGAFEEKSFERSVLYANRSVAQFRKSWRWALVFWALLYTVLSIEVGMSMIDADMEGLGNISVFFLLAKDSLNAASNCALLACYLVLAERTVDSESSPFAWLFLVALIPIIELCVVGTLAVQGNEAAVETTTFVFGAVMGVVGGAILGLLAGRLDSRHLRAPIWMLSLFFVYAAIQPLYPVLQGVLEVPNGISRKVGDAPQSAWSGGEYMGLVLLIVAGLLKVPLYIFLLNSIKSGRLFVYALHMRRVFDSADSNWRKLKPLLALAESEQDDGEAETK